MKIWIDISSPPHATFFRALIKNLPDVLVTARDFGPLRASLKRAGIRHLAVGKHGGGEPLGKLLRSSERTAALARLVARAKPDVALAKHSVEGARVASGLGIPCVTVLDHESAERQSQLILPLADTVVAPWAIPSAALKKLGARRVRQFPGVSEVAHFVEFEPSRKVLKTLKLDERKPIVVARPAPYLSSHVSRESGIETVRTELRRERELQGVLGPRSPADRARFAKLGCIVPAREIDTLSLLCFADLMLGAGCSMNREAALAGCAVVSLYPDKLPRVDRFLIRRKLMSFARSPRAALALARKALARGRKKRAPRVMKLANPYRVIVEEIERLTGKRVRLRRRAVLQNPASPRRS